MRKPSHLGMLAFLELPQGGFIQTNITTSDSQVACLKPPVTLAKPNLRTPAPSFDAAPKKPGGTGIGFNSGSGDRWPSLRLAGWE